MGALRVRGFERKRVRTMFNGSNQNQLALSLLREVLDYDPETGIFLWKIQNGPRIKVGDVAGYRKKSDGYIRIMVNSCSFLAHRLAWMYVYGEYPTRLDHKNGIKHDNRIVNLRLASASQNNSHRKIQSQNTSGYKGIKFRRYENRWEVYISVNNERIYVGSFRCKHQAARAYNQAALKYHGEFASLNDVPERKLFDRIKVNDFIQIKRV